MKVVVMVLMDVSVGMPPMSDHSCVSHRDSTVLDPLGNLSHGSVVIAGAVVMSPVVVGQRNCFRFQSTANSAIDLVVGNDVLL